MSTQSPGGKGQEKLDEFCEESDELERAGAVKRGVKADKNVPYFFNFICGKCTASGESRCKSSVFKKTHFIFDLGFDAGELCRYKKEVENCERTLMKKNEDDSRKKAILKGNVQRKREQFNCF